MEPTELQDTILRELKKLNEVNISQVSAELAHAREVAEQARDAAAFAIKLEARLVRIESALERLDANIKPDFEIKLESRLTNIEASLKSLVGNGQPGRVGKVEDAVADLKQWRWKTTGYASGAAMVISIIGGVISHFLK